MKNLYLIGGGGHCRSCIDVIEQEGQYKIMGIFDAKENIGKLVLGYLIVAQDDEISDYLSTENYFLITIGQIKSSDARSRIYYKLKRLNANFATIISPRAYVSKHSKVGEGTIILHDALVNSNVLIGNNCIINSKALIEHDACVEENCHVSTASVINGGCKIGKNSFIGSNAVLLQGITTSENAIIAAGSFYRGEIRP